MKRSVILTSIAVSALLMLGSCKDNSAVGKDPLINEIVSDINASAPSAAETEVSKEEEVTEAAALSSDSSEVDIDLTAMNSTMIYSVIYDMMVTPSDYYGKTLKVNGFFDTMYDETTGSDYFFVVVPDALACCMQGIEFKLDDSKVYPDDYPAVKDDICVSGVLDCYMENGQEYACIMADSLTMI